MTSTTDRLGQRRDFGYDEVNRKLTEKWYSTTALFQQTQTFTYDANGNLLTALDPDGNITFTYDALDRVSTVAEPFGLAMTFSYDAASNRTAVQDNQGGKETFTYDGAERLTNVKFTGNSATVSYDMSWTDRNELKGVTRYNDISGSSIIGKTSYTYDSRGRLATLWHKDGSATSLENTTFTYDTFDRLTVKTVDGTAVTYTYDDNNELTNDGGAYSYDANGNRTGGGYTTGTGNQITNDGTWSYTYDTEGNRSKRSKGANLETWNYGYDQQNHLVWVEKHATDGGTLQLRVDYKYDALGQRIERTLDNDGNGSVDTTERFGYDGENVWADLDGSSTLTYRRLYGTGVDTPMARISAGGAAVWYLTDYQNSVTVMVNASGGVIGRISYDGFGKITSDTTGGSGDRYKYTGREWDSSVVLQYNRARYYDAAIGKWTSTDPMGFDAGDANLYRYVRNCASNAIDPTGLEDYGVARPEGQVVWDGTAEGVATLTGAKIETRNFKLKPSFKPINIVATVQLYEWNPKLGKEGDWEKKGKPVLAGETQNSEEKEFKLATISDGITQGKKYGVGLAVAYYKPPKKKGDKPEQVGETAYGKVKPVDNIPFGGGGGGAGGGGGGGGGSGGGGNPGGGGGGRPGGPGGPGGMY